MYDSDEHRSAVANQRERLLELQRDPGKRQKSMEWFARRRPVPTGGRPADLAPVELIGVGQLGGGGSGRGGGEVVAVVADELFIDESGALTDAQLRKAEELGCERCDDEGPAVGNGQLRRLRVRAGQPVEATIRSLRNAGIKAEPIHIVPLNWEVKGKAGPTTTKGVLVDRCDTARSGVKLVVVDTGLGSKAKCNRDDGWLTLAQAATGEPDVDPLDQVDRDGRPGSDGCLDLGAGHGTSVAGVAEAVMPGIEVTVLRALGPDGIGDERRLAAAIRKASGLLGGRGVINLSLGCHSCDDRPMAILQRTITELLAAHDSLIVVAAAGNYGSSQKVWPAAIDGVVSVAGLTEDGTGATWSSRGSWVTFSAQAEGVIAPYVIGSETPSMGPDDPYDDDPDTWDSANPNALWLGTSFAAPQVAAKLAELLHDNSGMTRDQAVATLQGQGTAISGYGVALPGLLDGLIQQP